MRALIIVVVLLCSGGAPAFAKPLIADMDSHTIKIDSSFTGTQLLMFGVRNDAGDLMVVIRGPERPVIVRKKERIAGIWINRDQKVFHKVPAFYSIASTRPLDQISPVLTRNLRIGAAQAFVQESAGEPAPLDDPFLQAVLRYQGKKRLLADEAEPVTFMDDTLFKTVIHFPDSIPRGMYTAEVYLLQDGELVGMQSTPIEVIKTGFEAFIYDFAHYYSALYGLLAVAIAVAVGWAAGRIFETR